MSGASQIFSKYVLPGVQTALGAGSELVAPGNPAGFAMMGSGVGQLTGGGMGTPQGSSMGGSLGGLGGGLANPMGAALPAQAAQQLATLNAYQQGMGSNPAYVDATVSQLSGVNPTDPNASGAQGGSTPSNNPLYGVGSNLSGVGDMSKLYMQYLMQKKLQQAPAFRSGGSGSMGPIQLMPVNPFQLPRGI